MSNTERAPEEIRLDPEPAPPRAPVEVVVPREVPLGGPRAMTVRRTLPTRARSLVGAWCFLDHYGPDDVADTGGMRVPRHPHTGLQTVSWLFTGEIEHRDSAGHHTLVRPGELNLMTAGHGISHSEDSTEATDVLHGAQLWVALPAHALDVAPRLDHHVPEPVEGDGWSARVFLGTLLGATSPVEAWTELTGAEIVLDPGADLALDVPPHHEHALLVDTGTASLDGQDLTGGELGVAPSGRERLTLRSATGARVLLVGGEPLGEEIVMWWNFVGRTHEDIARHREEWMSEIAAGDGVAGRFGPFAPGQPAPLPAPRLPGGRLRPRG